MAAATRQTLLRKQLIHRGDIEDHYNPSYYIMSENIHRDEVRKKQTDSSAQSNSEKYELIYQRRLNKAIKLREQLRFVDGLSTVLSLGGLLLSFIELEDNYTETEDKERYESSDFGVFLKVLVSLATMALVVLVHKHHHCNFLLTQGWSPSDDIAHSSFRHSIYFKYLLFESALCLIHPLP